MKVEPLQDVGQRPNWETASHNRIANAYTDPMLPVRRVKVRRVVITVQDRDRYPQESADDRHS